MDNYTLSSRLSNLHDEAAASSVTFQEESLAWDDSSHKNGSYARQSIEPVGERPSNSDVLRIFRALRLQSEKIDGARISARTQYAVLRAIVDRQPKCFVSLERLAQESGGYGYSTVRRAVRALERSDFIKTQTYGRRIYRLVSWPKLREAAGC